MEEAAKKDAVSFKLSLWNYLVIGMKGVFGGGMASVITYLLELLNTKVLAKLDPEDLKKYSQAAVAVAECVEKIVAIFVTDEAKKAAADTTVEAIKHLATILEDGKVTSEELDAEIDKVIEAIDAWKKIAAA